MDKEKKKNIRVNENVQSNGHLIGIYHSLFQRFGPQKWWPGETPFEVVVGAILTQNTAWSNVARAIQNLKHADSLDPESLYNINIQELCRLIRPSGYFQIKGKRLKEFIGHLFIKHDGRLEKMFNQDLSLLRQELLGIKGIGPETADSIILYAANKPIFVVDAYTKRIFTRHGYLPEGWSYTEIQKFFMDNLPRDVHIYNEYHALIVRLAKEHCKTKAVCHQCPLENENDQKIMGD
ncbi:MAG: endonuclease III domain-containing protein [bacterium]